MIFQYCLILETEASALFVLSVSFLLSLQFLSKVIAWLYYCLMELSWHSDFISLHQIILFMPLLNSSTKGLSSYLLSLAALLNSWTNSSIVLLPYFNSLNSAISLSSLSNSFLISIKNSPAISYSNNPFSKSSDIFSFYTSADPPYIYDNTHWIYSFTVTPLIFILMYNLHAVTKSETLDEVSSNTYGLITSMFAPYAPFPLSTPVSRAYIYACITASCFYCCWMICS